MKYKKSISGKRTLIMLSLIVAFAIILSGVALAANNPGHDTLYIEQDGDSELNGSFNVSQNLTISGGMLKQRGVFTFFADDNTPATGTYVSGTSAGNIYLEGQGNIYLKNVIGGDAVYVGTVSGTPTDLNVSGALYVRGGVYIDSGILTVGGQAVCLANGTNCPSLGGGSAGAGWTNTSTQTTTVLNVGIGAVTPTQMLDVNGNINISNASARLYAPQICLNGDCQTSWPTSSGSGGGGGWTNNSENTTTTLKVGLGVTAPEARLTMASLGGGTDLIRAIDTTNNLTLMNINHGSTGNPNIMLASSTGRVSILLGGSVGATLRNGAVIGNRAPNTDQASANVKTLAVIGKGMENVGYEITGNECLLSGNFDNGNNNWSTTNDCSVASGDLVCTFSAGTNSLTIQYSENFTTAMKANTWYVANFSISASTKDTTASTAGYASITIGTDSSTNAVVASAIPGNNTILFKTGTTTPTYFRIATTLVQGQSFTMTSMSVKEAQSGGFYTGGGVSGLTISPNGTVGIGIDFPTQTFDVNGSINATSIIYAPQICLNGDCQTSWPTSSGSGGGGGWTNSTTEVSLVTATNNVSAGTLYVDNSNTRLGVNTTTPNAEFVVQGDGIFFKGTQPIAYNPSTTDLFVSNADGYNSRLVVGANTSRYAVFGWNYSTQAIYVGWGGPADLTITKEKRVGIGTSNPNERFEVSDNTRSLTISPNGSSETSPIINTTGSTNITITSSGGNVIIQLG